MTVSRPYGDACGAAHAMELVGERWSMLLDGLPPVISVKAAAV